MERQLNKNTPTGDSARVLIPVDFSPKDTLSLKVGFELARRLDKKVTLLHASSFDIPVMTPEFPDDFNGMDNETEEMEEMLIDSEIHENDVDSMSDLKRSINRLQSEESFPKIEFNDVIATGMPEEVIAEYCVASPPAVVVMATRGKEKRREDLIGSVTAEVIDHCLAPVFTVPEGYSFSGFKSIVRVCVFCYFDEGDYSSVASLMRMFDNPDVKIFLFPATDKLKGAKCLEALGSLQGQLRDAFPNSEFQIGDYSADLNLRQQAEEMFRKNDIQMILAPNRKRNALARFFSPGLAHKILYEIDFPMLAIPV